MLRYDKGEVKRSSRTPEGFLVVDAVVTRTGIFNYKNLDGSLRRELRHPEDVLDSSSLESMQMLPITVLHPKERVVTAENSKNLSVGYTGQDVKINGDFIETRLKITDKKAITAIENGLQELSLGYGVELIKQDGEFNGQRYDARQTKIRYNHLAIVPRGRAGREARIILDKNDAEQHFENKKQKTNEPKQKEKNRMLVKHVLDGIEYETAPEIKNALDKALSRADKAENENVSLKEGSAKLQAKADTAEEEVKALKKVDHSDDIKKAVKARISLERSALEHLDEKECEDLESKSDEDIKKAIILKHFPNAQEKLDGAEEAYINARLDSALEIKVDKKEKSNTSKQYHQMQKKKENNDTDEIDSVKSRNDYAKDLENHWKNKA